jgi:ribosomal protein uL24
MSGSPHSPRRQRRAVFNATSSERRRRMTVPLSRELRSRFHRRSVPIRKGDTVRVMKGSYVGREERVARVSRRDYTVTLDNVTLKSGEEKLKPLPIRTNHLLLVRLNLADEWRRETLKVRAEELTPEERGEVPEVAEPEEAARPAPRSPSGKDEEGPGSDADDEEDSPGAAGADDEKSADDDDEDDADPEPKAKAAPAKRTRAPKGGAPTAAEKEGA